MLPKANLLNDEISVYIHWPFCKSKCPYCDFNSHVVNKIAEDDWIEAYVKQIDLLSYLLKNKKVKSIFFGGGTPSLMPVKIVDKIINKLNIISLFDKNIEITLEANPTSSEAEKFIDFASAGINRLSIGVQSFSDERLKFLGREHNSFEALKAIDLAKSIFSRFSFDLIYATKNQTIDDWQKELNYALGIITDHVSLYQLTIEKGTDFYSKYQKGVSLTTSQDEAELMYDLTSKMLSEKGFHRYEISNYAKEGCESRHNLGYWNYSNYLGIGPGAHSRISYADDYLKVQAFYNIYNPQNWLKNALNNISVIQGFEILTNESLLTEILMMGLRLQNGILNNSTIPFFGKNVQNLINRRTIDSLFENYLLFYDNDRIKLTDRGMNLHQAIISKITDNFNW